MAFRNCFKNSNEDLLASLLLGFVFGGLGIFLIVYQKKLKFTMNDDKICSKGLISANKCINWENIEKVKLRNIKTNILAKDIDWKLEFNKKKLIKNELNSNISLEYLNKSKINEDVIKIL